MFVLVLAGCGDTTGVVGAGRAADTADIPGVSGTAASSRPSATPATPAGGAWVLSAPSSVFGFHQIQPPDAMARNIQAELTKDTAPLGVTGTPILAVYDDPTHDVYLIFAGYNGAGFDPARLKPAVDVAPATTDDGAGDRWVTYSESIEPGPHGGAAGCKSVTAQVEAMAAESTGCLWMTSTTLGSISYYPKPDQQKLVFGAGPDVIGKVMRDLRDLVERRA
jgi:hypothetical protein